MHVMRGILEAPAGLGLAILLAALSMGAPPLAPDAISSARAAETRAPEGPAGPPDTPRAEVYTLPETPALPETPRSAVPGTRLQSLLGREIRTRDDDPGRIIDILCDGEGRVRAAVVELGGFLGIGMRRIAVHWAALRFDSADPKQPRLVLDLAREELRSAPEYKPGDAVEALIGRPD